MQLIFMVNKRITVLTKAEDALYCSEFAHYMNHVCFNTNKADIHAWKICVKNFPRLSKFDGAAP